MSGLIARGTVDVADSNSNGRRLHSVTADEPYQHVTPGLLAAMTTSGDGLDASVSAAVEGDPRAIERVLASIRPLVVRYCRARVGRQERNFASADDVAQEVCLAVLTALPSYRDQGRPFLAFVYGIAAHKVADAHRAAGRNRSEPVAEVPDEPETDAGPEQRALRQELTRQMSELLQVLPDKQREIVLLRVVVGLSAEETAEAVGSTPGAVRVAQHRALARLRKTLSAEEVV
jgi:RNA polymerase sigma-70 factor, ECF subfamily